MPAKTLVAAIERHGCQARVKGGRLFVKGGRQLPADLRRAVAEHRGALIEFLVTWHEAEAHRLLKRALDAVGAIYADGQPEWCHPLFDEIDAAVAVEDMAALRRLTAWAVELAAQEKPEEGSGGNA